MVSSHTNFLWDIFNSVDTIVLIDNLTWHLPL